MAESNKGILTRQGNDLFNRALAGQDKITYTRIVFSSQNNDNLTLDDQHALTNVQPQELSLPAESFVDQDGTIKVRIVGTNEKLTAGVYVRTYAVFAQGQDGDEILYGTATDSQPAFMIAYDGSSPQSLAYVWNTKISDTDKITVEAGNAVYATVEDLRNTSDNIIKEMQQTGFAKTSDDTNFTAKLQRNGIDVATQTDVTALQNSIDAVSSNVGNNVQGSLAAKENSSDHASDVSSLATMINTKTDAAYQNAVSAANDFTNSNASNIIPFATKDSALSYAKTATKAGICIYPDVANQLGKAITFNSIYTFGNQPLADATLGISDASGGKYTFNKCYATYNQSTQVVTLHGTITINSNLTLNVPIFNINIGQTGNNVISSSYYNSQCFTGQCIDLSTYNGISTYNGGYVSTINLEGCTFTLGYDANAKIEYTTVTSGKLEDYRNTANIGKFFYIPASYYIDANSQPIGSDKLSDYNYGDVLKVYVAKSDNIFGTQLIVQNVTNGQISYRDAGDWHYGFPVGYDAKLFD